MLSRKFVVKTMLDVEKFPNDINWAISLEGKAGRLNKKGRYILHCNGPHKHSVP